MALKLLKHTYKKIDLFYSHDMKEDLMLDNEMSLEIISWRTIEIFLEDNLEYDKLINVYAKKNNLERIAILLAHGQKIKNKWFYFNEDKISSVQGWINNLDGKYKVLILHSCNPGRDEIYSKKSPVLAPNEIYNNLLLEEGKVQIELFMPGSGYIDSYLIEEELKKLEK